MKFKKAVLAVACSGALVVGSVAATMAYLTDEDTARNTFTVGNVAIHLDETDYDNSNQRGDCTDCVDTGRDHQNAYKLIPNCEYAKDPTVTVKDGSEESFVRILVTINEQADLDAICEANGLTTMDFFGGVSSDWILDNVTKGNDDTRTYEFRHEVTVTALNGDVVLDDLFETVKVPSSITDEQLATIQGLEINVVAQAIQAAGFNGSADAAWDAWPAS